MKLSALPVVQLPIVNVSTDPLDLLLAGLVLRMKQLARTSPQFIELIYNRQFRIEIGVDGGISRQIIVDHGKVHTEVTRDQSADFRLEFVDSDYAVKTLLKGDPSAFMLGMQSGDIKMEGDFALLVWFNQAAKLIPPKVPKSVRQNIKKARQFVQTRLNK